MNRQHKLGYFSSYDRGLIYLLQMWPKIKEAFPNATLDVAYGWDLFVKAYANNPERMAWKDKVDNLMKAEGITHHGRVGQDKLSEIRKSVGIWAYTTDFDEINCITALECQRDGVVPVVIDRAALKETVQSGVKIDGDVLFKQTRENYLKELLAIMGDEKRWAEESKKAQEFGKSFTWDLIAEEWTKYF